MIRPGEAVAQLRWGRAKAAAEGAIEIGQIAEPDRKGDSADSQAGKTGVEEHSMRSHQAPAEHELRERYCFRLEQHMNIARRDMLAQRYCGHRQSWTAEIFQNIGLDRSQPCRAHATA